jgi:hypothetical protein
LELGRKISDIASKHSNHPKLTVDSTSDSASDSAPDVDTVTPKKKKAILEHDHGVDAMPKNSTKEEAIKNIVTAVKKPRYPSKPGSDSDSPYVTLCTNPHLVLDRH